MESDALPCGSEMGPIASPGHTNSDNMSSDGNTVDHLPSTSQSRAFEMSLPSSDISMAESHHHSSSIVPNVPSSPLTDVSYRELHKLEADVQSWNLSDDASDSKLRFEATMADDSTQSYATHESNDISVSAEAELTAAFIRDNFTSQGEYQDRRPRRSTVAPVRYSEQDYSKITKKTETLPKDVIASPRFSAVRKRRTSTARSTDEGMISRKRAKPNSTSTHRTQRSKVSGRSTATSTAKPISKRSKKESVARPSTDSHQPPRPSLIVKLKVRAIFHDQDETSQISSQENLPGPKPIPATQFPPPSSTAPLEAQVDSHRNNCLGTQSGDHIERRSDHVALLLMTRRLSLRTEIEDKPEPSGRPAVWAEDRHALCETTTYYRSFQGSCYMNGGLVRAMMFDENGHDRDFMDAEVIVSRAGGGMARDQEGKLMQVKGQSSNAQTRSMHNNMASRIPVVVICGNKNSLSPSKMPHRYCVLGFFKVTDIVHNKGRVASQDFIQYRFEKLNPDKAGWWSPSDLEPVLPLGGLPQPERHTCSMCQATHEQVYSMWLCLTPSCQSYWKLMDGTDPVHVDTQSFNPAWLKKLTLWTPEEEAEDPFEITPAAAETKEQLDRAYPHESSEGFCCPRCGMCNSRYKFRSYKCDNVDCDFEHYSARKPTSAAALRDRSKPVGNGVPLSYDTMEPYMKHWHENKLNHRVNYFEIPGLDKNVIVHMIANKRALEEEHGPDEMFTAMQEEDIDLERRMMVTGKGSVTVRTKVTIA